MSVKRGYIKFPRSIFGSRQWRTKRVFSEFEAAAYLCVKAAYVDGLEVCVEGKTITLQRGQLITSIRNLAEDWGWSKSSVQRLLAKMSAKVRDNSWDNSWDNLWDNLRIKVEPLQRTRFSLVTICNYDKYDCDDSGCTIPTTTTPTPGVGTTCGTTCGTSNIKDIEIKDITSTHTSNILSRYKNACACADMREQAYATCKELHELGYFDSPEAKMEGAAFWLVTYIYRNFHLLQFKMDKPLTTREAEFIIRDFGSRKDDTDDMARVLDAMNNSKGLHKRNRSVYHTLRKWLQQDTIRKKRLEDEQARIYKPIR